MSNDREFRIKLKSEADAGGVKLFAGHMGELNKTARELQSAFPQVSAAVRLLAGPAGVIFVAIEAFIKAKEALAAWNKELDDANEEMSKPQFVAGLEARKQALQDAQIELGAYIAKLDVGTDAEKEFIGMMDRAIAVMKAANEAQHAINDAGFDLDETRLRLSLEAGIIDHQTYFKKLEELQAAHRAKEQEFKEAEQLQNLNALGAKQQRLLDRQPGLQSAAETAITASGTAKATADAHKAELGEALERQKTIDADLKKAQADADAHAVTVTTRDGGRHPVVYGKYKDALDRAQAADRDNRAIIARDQAAAVPDAVAAEKAGVEKERAVADEKENRDAINALTETIVGLNQTILAARPGEHEKITEQDYQGLIKTNPESLTSAFSLDRAAHTQQLMATHQKISEQDKSFYDAVLRAMEERGQSSAKAHDALSLISGNQRTLAQKYQALVREQEQLQGQLQNFSRHGPP